MSIYVPSIKQAQTRNLRQLTVSVHKLKKQDTRVVFIVKSIQNTHKKNKETTKGKPQEISNPSRPFLIILMGAALRAGFPLVDELLFSCFFCLYFLWFFL